MGKGINPIIKLFFVDKIFFDDFFKKKIAVCYKFFNSPFSIRCKTFCNWLIKQIFKTSQNI